MSLCRVEVRHTQGPSLEPGRIPVFVLSVPLSHFRHQINYHNTVTVEQSKLVIWHCYIYNYSPSTHSPYTLETRETRREDMQILIKLHFSETKFRLVTLFPFLCTRNHIYFLVVLVFLWNTEGFGLKVKCRPIDSGSLEPPEPVSVLRSSTSRPDPNPLAPPHPSPHQGLSIIRR